MSAAPRFWQRADQLRRLVRGFLAKPVDIEVLLAAVERLTRPAALAAAR
jgi:hypothetical protein